MKATIFFGSLATLIGSIIYISKPTDAVGSQFFQSEKTTSTGSYSTTLVVEFPVTSLNSKEEYNPNTDIAKFKHCTDCGIGVYLEYTKEDIRCTNCGKKKN